MPGLQSGNDAADLAGVAKVLGCRDAAALAELRPCGLMKLTQRELLAAARVLRLTKVTRLNKEALLARVWEALQQAGALPPDAEPPAPAAKPARAPATEINGRKKSASSSSPSASPAPISIPPITPDPVALEQSPGVAVHKFDVGEGTTRGAPQDFAGLRAEAQAH